MRPMFENVTTVADISKNIAKGTTHSRVQFKNLAQAKFSKSQPNISNSSKLRILTKHSESRPNINSKIPTKLQLKISPKLQLQNPDETLCSKSEPKQTNKNRRSPHTLPSCKPAGERRGGMTPDRWSRGRGLGESRGCLIFLARKLRPINCSSAS